MAKQFAVLRPATPGYPIVSSQFEKAGLAIRALAPHAATLEDLFFRLTEDEPAAAPLAEAS